MNKEDDLDLCPMCSGSAVHNLKPPGGKYLIQLIYDVDWYNDIPDEASTYTYTEEGKGTFDFTGNAVVVLDDPSDTVDTVNFLLAKGYEVASHTHDIDTGFSEWVIQWPVRWRTG